MAKTDSALSKMREICLALPDVTERLHFAQPAFYVGGKMFATYAHKAGTCHINLGLEPEHAAALVASDPRFEFYPRAKNAVSMRVDGVGDWDEVRAHVLESYRIVAAGHNRQRKLPARPQKSRRVR